MRCAILDDLHIVMYMPIEPHENIEAFMARGTNNIIECFTHLLLDDSWTWHFWTYYFQVGTWIDSQSIIVVSLCCAYPKVFTPWINVETPMMDLVIPCGYCVSYCRFVDGGALTSATCLNQDTQTLIESYHGALKHWSSLETKGLRGQWINWLVWRFTTMVARQYTWLKWKIAIL